MMILNVNATRMELQRIRKRLKIAVRGHKLLKDKQDELMRQMLSQINEVKEKRMEIESSFQAILQSFVLSQSELGRAQVEEALSLPTKKMSVDVETKTVMSVKMPVFKMAVSGNIISYGYLNTSGEMDVSLIKFDKLIVTLFTLAEMEKRVQLLADEIDKTRRRVNALEYKLIPNLQDTIKFITMKLAEMERSNLTRLMKVKDIVREH
ncbi:TPA: V-type ATP synthase subunit D [candidate division WOR-3 bacterium]|uniref:V-type ATP synthase subunit D n=1 Tax=candidate division WOR-3 bacterium TaxID=2052148 RepID=A0A350HA21_UNCW3|nr:V-type ATP synthase subunit D [candidate division WOR-3 bacterium]